VLEASLERRLAERRDRALYRQRREMQSAQGARVRVSGRDVLQFCSNDYLGLASHPSLVAALQDCAAEFGVGAGASHLVSGHSCIHHELERKLAEITGRERALLFSSGYMANMGVITALLGKGDHIIEDRLNHASLLDAGLLSGARFQRFQHNDLGDLKRRLEKLPEQGEKLIAVDAVFSMDGDLAPLPELAALAREYGACLMADDAHGFGVLGQTGAGSAEHFALSQRELPVLMGTLGKGLGSFGAFVAGSEILIESLIQFARPYIYTTAMPSAVAAATLAGLELLSEESWRRDHLRALIERFRREAERLGLPLMASATAIQPLLVGEEQVALDIAAALEQRGVLISAIRPPTVPRGTSRLRITLSAAHSNADLDALLGALDETVPRSIRGGGAASQ
jgi:8-amino-7-oxononanoate synthase